MTRSARPAPEYATPEPLRMQLAGLLTTVARGRGNALKLQALQARLRWWSSRQIRRALRELLLHDRLPIAGDSGAGYYLVETEAERLRQCREIGSRVRHLGQRLRVFAGVSLADTTGQPALDFSLTAEEIAAGRERVGLLARAVAALEAATVDLDDDEEDGDG